MKTRIIIIALLLFSCKGGQQNSNNISVNADTSKVINKEILHNIALYKTADNSNSLHYQPIDSIIQSKRFVVLEEGDESMLSITNVFAGKLNGKYIVSSYMTPIIQFDTTGGYEKKIINIGRSNKEINTSLGKTFISNDKLIVCQSHKLLTYHNNKVEGYTNKKFYSRTLPLKDSTFVSIPLGLEVKDGNYLDFSNQKFQLISEKKYNRDVYYSVSKNYTGSLEAYGLYPSHSNDALFKDVFNDTIYIVKGIDTIKPYIVFDYDKLRVTIDNIENGDAIVLRNISESGRYIFITYTYKQSAISSVYDKFDGEIITKSQITYNDNNSVINAPHFIDYVTPKGKTIKIGITSIYGDNLCGYIRPIDAIGFIEGVNRESNPIFVDMQLNHL